MAYILLLLQKWRARLRILLGYAPSPSPVMPSPAEPGPVQVAPNRAQRRAANKFERARLRQDVWAEPQGPQPVPRPKAEPRQPKSVTPGIPAAEEPTPDGETLIVDKINDIDEDVLIKESELWGEFNFRDSILDQLDRYWVYLERMRKHDPDSYGFYKAIGATIIPRLASHTHWQGDYKSANLTPAEIEDIRASISLPAWFNHQRPSFGCIAYGAHSLSEKHEAAKSVNGQHRWIPKFLYYTKYSKPPPEIQPAKGGDVYKLTIWWDRPQDKRQKWGIPEQFAIFINKSGEMNILRVLDTTIVKVPRKHSSWEVSNIPQRAWHLPHTFDNWAARLGIDPQLHMKHLFCTAIKEQEFANLSMIRVAVTKSDMTAVFGVAIHRTAYFFQDRDYELNEHGARKRIFHIVRAHKRVDGSIVKMHFRGAKTFHWAGYDVEITVPGLDHFMPGEYNEGLIDDYWAERNKKYLTEPEFGQWLKDKMHQGLGSIKRSYE